LKSCRVAIWAFLSLAAGGRAQDGIWLKSGRTAFAAAEQAEALSAGGHLLIQFRTRPGPEVEAELVQRGMRILRYVPDSTLMIASAAAPDLSGLDVQWIGRLVPSDKISPLLRNSAGNAFLTSFHPDVEMDRARDLAGAAGFDILPNASLLDGQLLLTGPIDYLQRLAEMDEVAYILPASVDLVAGESLIGCPGALTESGLMAEYVASGKGWSKSADGVAWLNYVLLSFPGKLTESGVRGEIERAFREWERYGNIRFTEGQKESAARTLAIKFAAGSHGDGYPFDGAGKVLAHTFYPSPPNSEPIAGDMHFDGSEPWSLGTYVDLYSVVLHETGHALGLGHSDQPGAVMYPYYKLVSGLAADDIAGVRALYGTPSATPTVPPGPTTPTSSNPATPTVPTSPNTPATPTAPASDRTSPALWITSPGTTIVATSAASIRLSGTASDNVGVKNVQWTTSTGEAGTATGTTGWSAVVPLLVGTSTITVRAYDTAGNSGWRSITVVRR
jgi:hypothetical protein